MVRQCSVTVTAGFPAESGTAHEIVLKNNRYTHQVDQCTCKMLLKSVPNSTSLFKFCTSSSNYTTTIRNLFVQTSHLQPRKPRWTDQSEDNYSGRSVSASSHGALHQNKYSEKDDSVLLKCRQLIMSEPDTTMDSENSDISYYAKFGLVRLDSDNKSHLRGHDGELADDLNVVDEQYFGGVQISGKYECLPDDQSKNLTETESEPGEFIDRHYFGTSLDQDVQKESNITNISISHSKQDLNKEKLNYVDEVFFQDETSEESAVHQRREFQRDHDIRVIGDFEKSLLDVDHAEDVHSAPSLSPHAKKLESDLLHEYTSKIKPSVHDKEILSQENSTTDAAERAGSPSDVGVPVLDDAVLDENCSPTILTETKFFNNTKHEPPPNSAFEYAVNLRKQKKEALQETSESGILYVPRYKKIINSVLDLTQLSKYELRGKLEKWIIYDENDIVGFYKPYGLRAHGGGEVRSKGALTLTDLLPELCKIVSADHLYHIHRLDANTTGVLLFARTEATAMKLRQMFKEHTLIKTYLAIVKNVPSLAHGLIDVPLKEGMVDGKTRMVPRPDVEGLQQRNKKTFKAVTKFKVLSKYHSAALVSAQPVTGVKHQIRAHLGLVLNCPILADHKYSSSTRMVPQKLPSDILQTLQIKQSRVRDLPIMLHSSSIFLPQFVDGKNLKISCPPPPHFTIAMKALKLSSSRNATQQKSFDYVDLASTNL
ncbi:Pseudouridine synthase RsuA/RluB/C/D/E/F [Trinorchestia longiramus]|nr:Pseudouridine synthase RsuA/RluB/C/D/E/F [Trinorchestia longiramus]